MGRASTTSLTSGRAIALFRAVNVGGRILKMDEKGVAVAITVPAEEPATP